MGKKGRKEMCWWTLVASALDRRSEVNRHDVKQLEAVLYGVAVERPTTDQVEQHLFWDKAYRVKKAL